MPIIMAHDVGSPHKKGMPPGVETGAIGVTVEIIAVLETGIVRKIKTNNEATNLCISSIIVCVRQCYNKRGEMGSPVLDYLPSKNFVKIIGSFLVILGLGWLGLFIWNNWNGAPNNKLGFDGKKPSLKEAGAEAQKDTDNDGLKDWEEALWRTNPEINDTDGDETNDGDEIKAGRDPKIAGICPSTSPGQAEKCTDKLQNPEELSKNKNSDEPATFTAKIAEEFGKNYFAGKGVVAGESLSVSAQQSLADSIVLGIEQGVAAYQDVFKKEDLKVSEFLSPKIYLDKLGNAFNQNFKDIKTSEVDIINFVISGNYFDNVKLFEPLITAYKNMVLFLQKEMVPETYADLHLSALNIMQNTLFAVRAMKNIEEDPAKAIIGIRLYTKESEKTGGFLKNLKIQVEKDKMDFKENEGGYFFNKYFEQI